MNLEKHISILLYTNDCVIVPGFGAFLTQKNNSFLEAGSVSPPAKKIGFNGVLQKSDGLLTQMVAQQNNLSYNQALMEVENQISFWKNHLEKNNSLTLDYLGTFSKNASGTLEFNPVDKNYLLESFGLEKISTRYIMQAHVETDRSNGTWWKVASVIPLLIGGYLYFAQPKPVADFVNEQWSGFVVPLVNPEVKNNKNTEPAEPKTITEVPAEAIPEKTNHSKIHDYQVIAGAFRVKSEAEIMELKLKEKGFPNARFTQKKGNYFYVAFETFETKEEALQYRKTVNEDYPETWVLSLKED